MIEKLKKYALFVKIIFSIAIGICVGVYLPQSVSVFFIEISNFLQNLIGFLVPLIVIGFVVSGISTLKNSSGKLLSVALGLSYVFMIIGAICSYFVSKNVLPVLLGIQSIDNGDFEFKFSSNFSINIPPLMDVTTAIILAFIIGVGISKIRGNCLRNFFDEFHDIVDLTVQKIMIPVIPFYIMGVFAKISSRGKIINILFNFSKLVAVIICMHIAILLFQYIVASIISKKNVFKLLKNIIPAYVMSLATQSSVAVIPFSIDCAENNGVSKKIANFILPLCSTIHLTGSAISITANVLAVAMLNNEDISFGEILPFILILGIIMVAAPGVPCGTIFAIIPVLKSSLGFTEGMIGMIVALHVAQDGFGTACNVTGDGSIAVIIEQINSKYFEKSAQNIE